MSYCRFSSDNWTSDVYCYEHVDGSFMTHVAGNRVVGVVPPLPAWPTDDSAEQEVVWVTLAAAAHKAQMEFLDHCERAPIGLPHDGETFADAGLSGMLGRLLWLQKMGYHVPTFAINAVREEMMAELQKEAQDVPVDAIDTPERYDAIMLEIHRLMDLNPTAESREGEMLAALATLAERYEQEMFPLPKEN